MSQLQQVTIGVNGKACGGTIVTSRARDGSFDFLKGFLVIVMVAHHALEYFAGKTHPFIKYLDFVTGGFVFAAGFMVVFLMRSGAAADRVGFALRLIKRGLKLIVLFLLVNVVLGVVPGGSSYGKSLNIEGLFRNLGAIMAGSDKSLAVFL